MAAFTSPIAIGTASANAAHKADLGKTVTLNGKVYVCVRATAAIATAAKKGVVLAFTAGVPTWYVGLPTDEQSYAFGIIPDGQTGSTGTTGLVADDFFMLQVSGAFTGLSATTLLKTTMVSGLIVTSLGYVKALGSASVAASLVVLPRNTGYLTNTAVCSAGDDITGFLAGLI